MHLQLSRILAYNLIRPTHKIFHLYCYTPNNFQVSIFKYQFFLLILQYKLNKWTNT